MHFALWRIRAILFLLLKLADPDAPHHPLFRHLILGEFPKSWGNAVTSIAIVFRNIVRFLLVWWMQKGSSLQMSTHCTLRPKNSEEWQPRALLTATGFGYPVWEWFRSTQTKRQLFSLCTLEIEVWGVLISSTKDCQGCSSFTSRLQWDVRSCGWVWTILWVLWLLHGICSSFPLTLPVFNFFIRHGYWQCTAWHQNQPLWRSQSEKAERQGCWCLPSACWVCLNHVSKCGQTAGSHWQTLSFPSR